MKIHLTGHGFELTEAIRAHVNEKFNRLSVFSQAAKNDLYVVLHAAHGTDPSRAEAKMHTKIGEIFAQAKHEDLYHAISECAHKIQGQLTKKQERAAERRSDAKRMGG